MRAVDSFENLHLLAHQLLAICLIYKRLFLYHFDGVVNLGAFVFGFKNFPVVTLVKLFSQLVVTVEIHLLLRLG